MGETVRALLECVRDIAHGVFPAVLADVGLDAALRTLADDASATVRLKLSIDAPAPAAFDRTAYLIVRAAVAGAGTAPIQIRVASDGDRLVMQTQGGGALPPPLRDRVHTLGGTVMQHEGVLEVVLLCG